MCARHVDSTNPGRNNLVFRAKPIPEAEMSNRLIREPTSFGSKNVVKTDTCMACPMFLLSCARVRSHTGRYSLDALSDPELQKRGRGWLNFCRNFAEIF